MESNLLGYSVMEIFYYIKNYMIENDGFPYSIYMNYKKDKDTQKNTCIRDSLTIPCHSMNYINYKTFSYGSIYKQENHIW